MGLAELVWAFFRLAWARADFFADVLIVAVAGAAARLLLFVLLRLLLTFDVVE